MAFNENNNEEAMTAAMQETFRLEFQQRQARENDRPSATVPPSDIVQQVEVEFIPAESHDNEEGKDAALAPKLAAESNSEDADLRDAQQLQDEETANQMSQEKQQEQAPGRESARPSATVPTSTIVQQVEVEFIPAKSPGNEEGKDATLAPN
jgi:hypothetical protein